MQRIFILKMEILFLIVITASCVAVRITGHFFLKRFNTWAEKSKTILSDLLAKDIRKYLLPAAYFAAFYLSTEILVLSPALSHIISALALAGLCMN